MGTVAIALVERVGVLAQKTVVVISVSDQTSLAKASPKGRMAVVDACVDDGDFDALTCQSLGAELVDMGHVMGRIGAVGEGEKVGWDCGVGELATIDGRGGYIGFAVGWRCWVSHLYRADWPEAFDSLEAGYPASDGIAVGFLVECKRSSVEEARCDVEDGREFDILNPQFAVEGLDILWDGVSV